MASARVKRQPGFISVRTRRDSFCEHSGSSMKMRLCVAPDPVQQPAKDLKDTARRASRQLPRLFRRKHREICSAG